jgi:hypothetical protein
VKNHEEQDNLKSAKLLKQVELLSKLVEGLGFASPVDQQTVVSREEFLTNWVCNIVDDDAFKDHQQINQLFDLRKNHQISEGMESKQILAWANALGKPCSIAVRAVDKHGGGYRLEVLNEMLELIKRKNNHGKFYQDGNNLLGQQNKDGDPFIDEETGETLYQKIEKKQALARNSYDTSRLDVGVDLDDD